jgi:hypothetical protein
MLRLDTPPFATSRGTEIVQFSPAEELEKSEAVMMKNLMAMQGR